MGFKNYRFLSILILILIAAMLWACHRATEHMSEPQWLLIKWYAGAVESGQEVVARIYVARQFSGDRSMDVETFLQNKIEVLHNGVPDVFLWPDDKSYAAGWAEVIDLDHDGTKEFMIGSDRSCRIVSYTHGKFRFRPALDEILSTEYDIGPFDLDSDGRYEFIDDQPIDTFPQQYGASVPRIKQWNAESGFVDVSGGFKSYYEQHLMPELRSKIAKEKDSKQRGAYEQALREIVALAIGDEPPEITE